MFAWFFVLLLSWAVNARMKKKSRPGFGCVVQFVDLNTTILDLLAKADVLICRK